MTRPTFETVCRRFPFWPLVELGLRAGTAVRRRQDAVDHGQSLASLPKGLG